MINENLFIKNIYTNYLINKKKILVAVSGGVDSMVLLYLLMQAKCNIGVAHVNFNLRGKDSDKDEFFVQKYCFLNKIFFISKKINIKNYALNHKISIQMAARKIRYIWFKYIINIYNYDLIATGHHLDDSKETFFINLIRGTGIKGLIGINPFREKIMRPLLIYSKSDIIEYAYTNNIKWINDNSNQENKYLRNYIRNNIIIILNNISNNFNKSFKKTIQNLYEENIMINNHINDIIKIITLEKHENPIYWKIDCQKIINLHPIKSYLFKLFAPYGFYNIKDLINIIKAQSGKFLLSNLYRIIKHNNNLLLVPIQSINYKKYFIIDNLNFKIQRPFFLNFCLSNYIDKDATISINIEKIKLPLYLRTWKKGDFFYSQNQKKQKLSKYFKKKKFSLLDKENTWILLNYNQEIIWIIGQYFNQKFQAKISSIKILNIYYKIKNNV